MTPFEPGMTLAESMLTSINAGFRWIPEGSLREFWNDGLVGNPKEWNDGLGVGMRKMRIA